MLLWAKFVTIKRRRFDQSISNTLSGTGIPILGPAEEEQCFGNGNVGKCRTTHPLFLKGLAIPVGKICRNEKNRHGNKFSPS